MGEGIRERCRSARQSHGRVPAKGRDIGHCAFVGLHASVAPAKGSLDRPTAIGIRSLPGNRAEAFVWSLDRSNTLQPQGHPNSIQVLLK